MSSKIAEARAALTELADWSTLTLTPDDFSVICLTGPEDACLLYLTSAPEQGEVGTIFLPSPGRKVALLFFDDYILENYYVES